MRISDWSSDVCSSDLNAGRRLDEAILDELHLRARRGELCFDMDRCACAACHFRRVIANPSRKSMRSIMRLRSEEHTSELQSLMRISYAVFCLKKKKDENNMTRDDSTHHTMKPDTDSQH